VAGCLSVDKILEGCSGKKGKTHCVMKPSCGWISAVDSIQKFMVVKFFDRRKNPQDVQGLTLYLGQIITLYLSLCCIINNVQHSVVRTMRAFHKFRYEKPSGATRSPQLVRLGCNNGGGGGNFSKVKQLFAKCIGTQKRLQFGFLRVQVGF